MSDDEDISEIRKFLQSLPVIGKFFIKRPKVSWIRLSGVIADSAPTKKNISYEKYADIIDKAFEKADQAVALIINSPGGSAAQSSLLGAHIRRKAEETELPVFAFVEDVAASGGYWLACAADKIYTQKVSVVGSIGVISASFGFHDLIDRYGIERRLHTEGKDKSFLDPFEPEKDKDVKRLKTVQKDLHQAFISWVKERRGDRLAGDDEDLFEGQFWTGEDARDLGIIDDIASPYIFLKDKYGDKVKFVTFDPAKKFIPSFLPFGSRAGGGLDEISEEILQGLEARIMKSRYGL